MSDINYSLLRSLTAKKFISALVRDGFSLDRQRGSHQQYRHSDSRRVTVSFHRPSDTFPPKTLKSMIAQAGWTREDLERLEII